MQLGNAFAVRDNHGSILQSDQFLIHKVEAILSYFELKIPFFFTFSERDFSTLKFLNYQSQNACNDPKQMFEWGALQI